MYKLNILTHLYINYSIIFCNFFHGRTYFLFYNDGPKLTEKIIISDKVELIVSILIELLNVGYHF